MIIKDLNLKAIHNFDTLLEIPIWLSMIIKDLNLKAIHNGRRLYSDLPAVVNDHQRSESENDRTAIKALEEVL